MSYFPMFVELSDRQCLVVGGGNVALRKVKVLKDFGAVVTVAAPNILADIKEISNVSVIETENVNGILKSLEWDVVIAATDDYEVNHQIADFCRAKKIPVNAVDQVEDCSFIFPSYIKKGEVTGAFTSGGLSPVITQYLKEQNHTIITDFIGELAEHLGSIREEVKSEIPAEERKSYYQQILNEALMKKELPGIKRTETVKFWKEDFQEVTWILFAESKAVDGFFESLLASDMDARDLFGKKIATCDCQVWKKLKKYGMAADIICENHAELESILSDQLTPLDVIWNISVKEETEENLLANRCEFWNIIV